MYIDYVTERQTTNNNKHNKGNTMSSKQYQSIVDIKSTGITIDFVSPLCWSAYEAMELAYKAGYDKEQIKCYESDAVIIKSEAVLAVNPGILEILNQEGIEPNQISINSKSKVVSIKMDSLDSNQGKRLTELMKQKGYATMIWSEAKTKSEPLSEEPVLPMKAEVLEIIEYKLSNDVLDINDMDDVSELHDALHTELYQLKHRMIDNCNHDLRKWSVDNWEFVEQAIESGLAAEVAVCGRIIDGAAYFHTQIHCGQILQNEQQITVALEEIFEEMKTVVSEAQVV